ncbi:adenylate/guanylate cyclase domain-containing protein [Geminicoccus sp.]|uniref:adenylate/guanylate cyclase domain-containing protein n=1 Tax=Geminicoccus sp. TaxID=2024832 RepID=UPI002E327108|nr:adenylate/guanylate cyclase domain-containing protein [Geminicoccus sp.]
MSTQVNHRRPRFSLGLGPLLVGGSVAFVSVVTVILVLFGLVNAREASTETLRQATHIVVNSLAERTRDHLLAASEQSNYVADLIESEPAAEMQAERIADLLVASLAAAPQVAGALYVRPDLTAIQAIRLPSGRAVVSIGDYSDTPQAQADVHRILASGNASWEAPFTDPSRPDYTFLNYRVPVRRAVDSKPTGLVVVSMRSDRLSRFMRELALPPIRSAFILYGESRVLAHPSFDGAGASNLPDLAEMPDPAMRALLGNDPREQFFKDSVGTTRLTTREVEGSSILYLRRNLVGFAPEQLWVGAYVDLDAVGPATSWYQMIAVVGLSIVAAAAVMAALLARRLTAAIRNLAQIAAAVARLELDPARQAERSRVRELDDLAQTFTNMLHAMAAFATYVPRQLVRRLLAAGRTAGPASEQRELTVLFTDLSGFSSMAEHRTAEETARLLNDHFSRMTACIDAEGGTVDKYLGDAVMAFWGAPGRQPDHAARAVRAAAAMERAFADDPMRRIHGLGLRIGIHTGVVLVGDIGGPERLNYTIIGDAVNVASRLVELGHDHARPDEIVVLLTQSTVAAAHSEGQVEDLGEQAVRGRFQDEHVFRLLPDRWRGNSPSDQAAA